MKIKKISQSAGVVANVVNSLDSNSSIEALSANQGKILNEKIEALENKIKDSYKVELLIYDHFTSEIKSIKTYSAYDYETWQSIINDTDSINSNSDFTMQSWVDGNPYLYYQNYPVYYGDDTHVQTTDRLIPGRIYQCTTGGGSN